MSKIYSQLGKIGFVLPAGSLRGAFQVGALRAFEEAKIMPAYIVGVSSGSLNATAFAAGKMKRLWEVYEAMTTNQRIFYRWNSLVLFRAFFWSKSLLINRPLKNQIIKKDIGVQEVFSSGIKVDVITTDLQTGQEVIFSNKNPLHQDPDLFTEAIAASCAIPAVFPPFMYNGHQLVDGGVINRSPISFAIGEQCDSIFVINTEPSLSLRTEEQFNTIISIASRSENLINWRSAKLGLKITREINKDLMAYDRLKESLSQIIEEEIKDEAIKKELKEKINNELKRKKLSFQNKRQVKILVIEPEKAAYVKSSGIFSSKVIPNYLEEGYNKTKKLLEKLSEQI